MSDFRLMAVRLRQVRKSKLNADEYAAVVQAATAFEAMASTPAHVSPLINERDWQLIAQAPFLTDAEKRKLLITGELERCLREATR